jgi:hypothetical protein
MDFNHSTIPTHAQTTAWNLTKVTSHHDGWTTNTLNHSTQAKHNIIKMEYLYGSHGYRGKHNYPDTNLNPKGKIAIQFKEHMQQCELEGESMCDQHSQGTLALLPAYCYSRSSPRSLESSQTMKRINNNN